MKKRLFTLLLALCLLVTLLPTGALAYVGGIREAGGAQRYGYVSGLNRHYMENDYLHFEISEDGTYITLEPPGTPGVHGYQSLSFWVKYWGQDKKELTVDSVDISFVGTQNDYKIRAVYDLGNDQYRTPGDVQITYTAIFELVRLDEGSTSATTTGLEIGLENDSSQTWGVYVDGTFEVDSTVPIEGITESDGVSMQLWLENQLMGFPNMGHATYYNRPAQAPVMLAKAYRNYTGSGYGDETFIHSTTNISQGLSETGTHPDLNDGGYYLTEVYIDSFGATNPFVALSQFYEHHYQMGQWMEGVEGFPEECRLPAFVSYTPGEISGFSYVTTVNHMNIMLTEAWEGGHYYREASADMLWGYRDVMAVPEEDEAITEYDKVDIPANADRLAVYPDGDGFRVEALNGNASVGSNAVAVIRGSFTEDDAGYSFSGGAAALSPTVTATWGNGGTFKVNKNGTIEQHGVHLNAPTFKFYLPSGGSNLSLSFTSEGIKMDGLDNGNSAVISVDIPRTKTTLAEGVAEVDGGLQFSGQLAITTIFDGGNMEMTELEYALKQGVFSVEGVKAEGNFVKASVLGIELGSVNGSINTFDEVYKFNAEIDVFSLLKARGYLELKRADSGELMPNDLYFDVDVVGGVPLVPPAPVVKLTGGSAGFYNLVDTINGDWYAIPPLKFSGSVDGKIVNVLDAKNGKIVIGPSQFELSVDKLGFVNANFAAFRGGVGMYLGGEQVTGNTGRTYNGVNLSGRLRLDVDLPSQSLNFLKFRGNVGAGVYGGLSDDYRLLVRVYGNSHASAELQFPDSWPLVGGWNILSAGVDAAVAAESEIDVSSGFDAAFDSLFDKLDVQVGLAATGSFLGSDVRVWVILPDVAQNSREDVNWGWDFKFWGSLPGWNWADKMDIPDSPGTLSTMSAEAAGSLMSADSGPALMGPSARANSQTVNISDVESEESAYMVLAFDEGVSEQEIKSSLKVTRDGGSDFALTWPKWGTSDGQNIITNSEDCNVLSEVFERSYGNGSDRLVFIYLGQGSSAEGSYTASTASTAGEGEGAAAGPAFELAAEDGLKVEPADSLGQISTNNDGEIKGTVEYPVDGAEYVLRTYLGRESGGTDYLVDERAISGNSFDVTIPQRGTAAPTGDYYMTSYLLRKVTYTDDSGQRENGYIAIDNTTTTDSILSYTNTEAPTGTPGSVTLAPNGNETMLASWSEVSDAAGYKVTIYEQEKGVWVDSGFGYEYDAAQFQEGDEHISGLSYENGTYTIDMAVTAGNAQEGLVLRANENYKVGVAAYNRDETAKLPSEDNQTIKYYGQEAQSDEAFLPAYKPLELEISYRRATGGGTWTAATQHGNGIYNLSAYPSHTDEGGYGSLGISLPDETETSSITITGMYYDGSGAEKTISFSTGGPSGGWWGRVPAGFAGSMMVEVTASETKKSGGQSYIETTTRYVLITVDDTAPIITLDDGIFYADDDGSFEISGVTEPGAKVEASVGGELLEATAGADGRFTLTGKLPEGSDSALLLVTATDAAGNESSGDDALVTRRPGEAEEPDEPDEPHVPVVPVNPVHPTEPDEPEEPEDEELPFIDVHENDWFYEPVEYVYNNGLMNGVSELFFEPNGTVTRGMIVTILHRLEGEPGVDYAMSFTDVAEGQWYAEAVRWAASEGIVNGVSDTAFAPDDPVTREQFAAILWRYAQYKGYDVSIGESTNLLSYLDFDEISEYAIPAMQWAVGDGVMSGRGEGILAPQGTATRAEAAAMLMRFAENVAE